MKYYKTDSRKISFSEYRHISPKGFWIAWWNKLLGRKMNLNRGIPEPQPFTSRMIGASAVPKAFSEKLDTAAQELKAIGFDHCWYCTTKESLQGSLGYGLSGLHSSRQIVANIVHATIRGRESSAMAFLSELQDGITLSTNNKKPGFNLPPGHMVLREIGAGAQSLFNLHQQRLAELPPENPPRIFAGLDDVAAFEDKLLQRYYEDKIQRGIWVEMTDAEVAALRVQRATAFVIPQR